LVVTGATGWERVQGQKFKVEKSAEKKGNAKKVEERPPGGPEVNAALARGR
jgi:hypothetical protein